MASLRKKESSRSRCSPSGRADAGLAEGDDERRRVRNVTNALTGFVAAPTRGRAGCYADDAWVKHIGVDLSQIPIIGEAGKQTR